MVTKYELPEEANVKLLSNSREEVEMKTFKTNVPPTSECDKDQVLIIKILCLGDYTGGGGGGQKRGAYQRLSASDTTGTD